MRANLLRARRERPVQLPHGEPGALAGGVPLDEAGREDFRGELHAAAHHALAPDDGGDGLVVHAVLHPDEDAIALEVGLDEFARPSGVEGFDDQQNDVEFHPERGQLAKMARADGDAQVQARHLHAQPLFAHRLHVLRPLVDDDDVEARVDQVGRHAAADGARAQDGDFPVHVFPPPFRVSRAKRMDAPGGPRARPPASRCSSSPASGKISPARILASPRPTNASWRERAGPGWCRRSGGS